MSEAFAAPHRTIGSTNVRIGTTTPQADEEDPFIRSGTACEQQCCAKDLSYTIVWSPLPVITWLVPFIGHTGICNSSGVASDFQGPYFVGDDGRMAFGSPTRSLKIVPSDDWDERIEEANEVYRGRMHNICCDNCHSHVAHALNAMKVSAYGVPAQRWGMVRIAILMFFRGRFLSLSGVVRQFVPFAILLTLFLWMSSV